VIGLGDADLYRQLLAELGIEAPARDAVLSRLASHDLVGLEVELSEVEGIGDDQIATCVALSQLRGDREVLDEARSLGGAAVERATARIGETFEALEARGVADRVQIDLGLLRDLGYYSGAILEVYDPAIGHVLGGGGRYDELLKRFGVDLPAAGFALYMERVHVAQMEEESRTGGEP
jgi:ATP phosphoribosyltransferase regulatory subunit HisZ